MFVSVGAITKFACVNQRMLLPDNFIGSLLQGFLLETNNCGVTLYGARYFLEFLISLSLLLDIKSFA